MEDARINRMTECLRGLLAIFNVTDLQFKCNKLVK